MTYPVAGKLLDACVLGVISKGETYGYDLTQKISSTIDVSESALYPVLRRLLKDNMLESYDTPIDGRNRKYYKITENGKLQLITFISDWKEHKEKIEKLIVGGNSNE